ncbi:peroxin [Blastocladiella emersonii ATCC 22665]|nr:peroxin [Blastocladiella emersonii ATCC 22665]
MDFLKRHRSKALWLGGLTAGAYLAGQYAKRRFFEAQEQAYRDRAALENIKRRFEQNQQDCTFTVLALLPELAETMFAELNAEKLAAALQSRRAPAPAAPAAMGENGDDAPAAPAAVAGGGNVDEYEHMSKAELWHELKIVNLTRLITALYAVSMLTVLTRVQLNLIGRLMYLDSVVYDPASPDSIATATALQPPPRFLPQHTESVFLTFSYHLLHSGWRACAARVRVAVESVFGGVPLKKPLTRDDLDSMLAAVRARVEATTATDGDALAPFDVAGMMLPAEHDEAAVLRAGGIAAADAAVADPTLRRLLDEARDVLEAPHARDALTACFDAVFAQMHAQLADLAFPRITSADVRSDVPLAALLPHAKQLVHGVINGVPNEYIATLSRTDQLQQLSMVIYAQFDGVCVE